MKKRRGFYLALEGLQGSGKSTQAKLLFQYFRERFPQRPIKLTGEPGRTEIAKAIRQLVQGTRFKERMNPLCDAYLYAAARAQSLRSVVAPTLQKGGFIISDRCYVSSLAVQGIAQSLGLKTVLTINREAIRGLEPDLILVIDLEPSLAIHRMHDSGGDKFENRRPGFYRGLRRAYRHLTKLFPQKLILVDGSGTEEQVFARILRTLDHRPSFKKTLNPPTSEYRGITTAKP